MSVVNDTNKNHVLSYEGLEDVVAKIKNTFVRNTKQASDDELGLIKALENPDVQLNELQGHNSNGNNYPVQIISDGTAFVNMPKPENVSTVDENVKNEVITDNTKPYFLLGQSAQNITSTTGTNENCYIMGGTIYGSDVIAGENVLSNKVDKEEGKGLTDVISVATDESIDEIPTNTYLQYVTQSLTDEQKLQSRTNIGAICEDDIFDSEFIVANGIASYDDKFYSLPDKATTDEYTLATVKNINDSIQELSNSIKTINNNSLLGSGDITIDADSLKTLKVFKINYALTIAERSNLLSRIPVFTSTLITTDGINELINADLVMIDVGLGSIVLPVRKGVWSFNEIYEFSGTGHIVAGSKVLFIVGGNTEVIKQGELHIKLFPYENGTITVEDQTNSSSNASIYYSTIYTIPQTWTEKTFTIYMSPEVNYGYSSESITIKFLLDSSSPVITWTSSKRIVWANGITPTFEGGKFYEVSFSRGPNDTLLGVCGVFE